MKSFFHINVFRDFFIGTLFSGSGYIFSGKTLVSVNENKTEHTFGSSDAGILNTVLGMPHRNDFINNKIHY